MRTKLPVLAVLALGAGFTLGSLTANDARTPASLEAASATNAHASQSSPGPLQGPDLVFPRTLPDPSDVDVPTRRLKRPAPLTAEAAGALVPEATSGSGTVAGAPSPPEAIIGFEGLASSDNAPNTITPPAVQVAAGPSHVVEFVNTLGRISTKQGAVLETFGLDAFFGVPEGHSHADPNVLYDALSGRFFATYSSFLDATADAGALYLAVSHTDDPLNDPWNVYSLPYVNKFPDYPGLGVTNDKVTVSANITDVDGPPGPLSPGCSAFDGFCGEQTIIFEKGDLLEGVSAASLGMFVFPENDERFSVRPAHSLSSGDDQYLTTWDLSSLTTLTVIRIIGRPDTANVAEASAVDLTTMTQLDPPPSRTAGDEHCFVLDSFLDVPPCIDSGDRRMLDAVWRNNVLWTSASASCVPPTDTLIRSCAHLVEIETVGAPSVVQDIMYGDAGEFFSWPAVVTDAANNLVVSLTHTNVDIFAEAVIAGRLSGDPSGTLSQHLVLRTGEVIHDSGRWGDSLGAAVDPSDPTCVWMAGEYAKATAGASWGTYVAAASFDDSACDFDTPLPTPGGPTPTPGSSTLFGDANCDGAVDVLDALLILQFDAHLLTSLPCEHLAHANLDGVITAVDAILVLQYDAGFIDSLPVGAPQS